VPELSKVEKKLNDKKENETTVERIKRLTGFDIGKCPKCKIGRMHIVRELPRIRSPSRPSTAVTYAHFYNRLIIFQLTLHLHEV